MLEAATLLIKRYRILGLHEMGHECPLYLAHDELLGVRVAVKHNRNLDPASQRQFEREAALLASLRHPQLPRGSDHFALPECGQFTVMDFIDGPNLQRLMEERNPATQEILAWAAAICEPLAYLHARPHPIIHRDIQPSNIILMPNGTPVLVDFGWAKVQTSTDQVSTAPILARPALSAPATAAGPRSDQYSLAATLYALLTGSAPAASIDRVVGTAHPIPPRSARPDLPVRAEEAILRALSLFPEERFADIQSFRQALTSTG